MHNRCAQKGLSFLVFFCIGIFFCTTPAISEKNVNFTNVAETAQRKKNNDQIPIRVGLIPQLSAVQMVKQWQPFMVYLSRELNRPVELILKSTYEDVISGIANDEMDMALLASSAYVQAHKRINVKPLVKPVVFGSPYYHSVIIVRKDSRIDSLRQLKGKSFAFTDKNSTSGYFLPHNRIKMSFGKPEAFFSSVLFTGNHDSALLAVYNGTVSGAGISTTRWNLNNSKVKDLKIIWKSKSIPLDPFVVKQDMDGRLVDKLRKAFSKFGKSETRDLAKQMEVDGFVPAYDNEYDIVRTTLKSFKNANAGE
jgi:phosphonate transport system substrate-binding protein